MRPRTAPAPSKPALEMQQEERKTGRGEGFCAEMVSREDSREALAPSHPNPLFRCSRLPAFLLHFLSLAACAAPRGAQLPESGLTASHVTTSPEVPLVTACTPTGPELCF